MTDNALRGLVLRRLEQETQPEDEWSALVLAALEGTAALESLLGTPATPVSTAAPTPATAAIPTPAAPAAPALPAVAFLRSIAVEGFRGIGPRATLDLAPGPGLTLVVGRNGSGKSSFAEALELLLTGDTYRWSQRTKVWQEGWRNLHHTPARIEATLALEGETGACTIVREWASDAPLEDATSWAQIHGKPRGPVEALGWETPLVSYRPFLSYNELGSLLDEGPSKLYDALAAILGLEALVDAQTRLRDARSARDKALKDADRERDEILQALEPLAPTDERAARATAALEGKTRDLDAVEQFLATGTATAEADSALALLKQLTTLAAPTPPLVEPAIAVLRHAAQQARQATETVAARADDLVTLLDHALRFHAAHGNGDCPVCGRAAALDPEWRSLKTAEITQLHSDARAASEARRAITKAIDDARRLPRPADDLLARAASAALDLDTAPTRAALADWHAALAHDDPATLADHIERTSAPLAAALATLREAATAELQRRQDAWRPHATRLAAWLPKARAADAGRDARKLLKHADDWLREAADSLRNERFAPIAEHAIRVWEQLRVQSNVSLGKIQLEGQGNRRRVDLDVTVDGQAGAALGVMSQGELHSLALSLFVPRASLPESPFRFMVVDDPVQSMDPARVDGLARVLGAAGRDRQVVVFTHDERLPEAIRRLAIDATIVEVTRREGSVVETRRGLDPIARYIEDALALAFTDELPPEAARRVIPGLCRMALEAACMEAARRRRIGRGERHTDVDALLAGAGTLNKLAALALFDSPERTAEVLPRLDREAGRAAADAFKTCNAGAHVAVGGVMVDLVRTTEKLAAWLAVRP